MGLRTVQQALRKVPLLAPVLKWSRDTARATWGPGWLNRQVREKAACGEPIRIIIGAGGIRPDPGWIPTDVQYLNLLVDRDWQQAFGDYRIDAIFAEHVWEHLTPANARAGAAQCFTYLKPGGYIRLAVPDGNHPDPEYIEFVRPGGYGSGADDHKVLYTGDTMREMLASVGFQVDSLEHYNADGSFHRQPWDPKNGRVTRCYGWTEKKRDGSVMQYSSVIADGRK